MDEAALDLVERRADRDADDATRELGALRPIRGQVARLDQRALSQHDGTLDRVGELAHVTRPAVALQPRQRLGREAREGLAVLGRALAQEVLRQHRDVLGALAERRHAHGHDVEPIEQIVAELPLAHGAREVAVGRGDQADVDLVRLAAEAFDLPVLQHAQELDLHVRRNLADLVEKERAAVGQREAPLVTRDRAGERAAFVAEQLRLEDRLGDRRAVHRDERLPGARAQLMHGARAELLAGAALTEQQHRRGGWRGLPHDVHRAPPRQRDADYRRALALLEARAQVAVLGGESVALHRLVDGAHDLGAAQRFGHEVVRALLHRLDGAIDRAVGGHEDDLGVGREAARGAQDVHAVHPGHREVGQQHVHRLPTQVIERGATVGGLKDAHPLALEDGRERLEDASFVIDA